MGAEVPGCITRYRPQGNVEHPLARAPARVQDAWSLVHVKKGETRQAIQLRILQVSARADQSNHEGDIVIEYETWVMENR